MFEILKNIEKNRFFFFLFCLLVFIFIYYLMRPTKNLYRFPHFTLFFSCFFNQYGRYSLFSLIIMG